ncbi:MAG: Hsp33 family molecular chaperone HslO [Clostridia bacterium]|nr:Hsp33 family molecular chaperone HslO [Clostridia bacterium]
MNENFNVLNLPDEMLHITLMDGQARVLLCRTTAMARRSADIHRPSSTALAAMSRTMTATAMLGVMMKDPDASVTVTVAGDGPIGKITAVAHGGRVKISAHHPEADLPLKADGHLDVGGIVGRNGRLTVIKDLGMKEPYIGQTALVSGELGQDFAQYFTVSEQQPSLVALGCLVHEGYCLSAGGVLVQAMPGCSEELLEQLELRSVFFSAISREVADVALEDLAKAWFDGLEMKILSRETVSYQCDCSRDKMEKALIALGRQELRQLIEEDNGAELTCHFCRTAHRFTRQDLEDLLQRASR